MRRSTAISFPIASTAVFHEQCCEQIFHDLMTKLSPETLEVRCLFTRRGGIDISPFRSTDRDEPERIWRAMRQ